MARSVGEGVVMGSASVKAVTEVACPPASEEENKGLLKYGRNASAAQQDCMTIAADIAPSLSLNAHK
eukprot:2476510-Amphidinium_carterae.1